MVGNTIIDWRDVDTLLLDMDGTLLDLAFDNFFWQELVPEVYATRVGTDPEDARNQLFANYRSVAGSLSWYCLDYWSSETGIDVRQLKWAHRRLIAFLPGVVDCLRSLRRLDVSVYIVTNAHPDTLAIKRGQTGLDKLVDGIVSSHDIGAAKESQNFWTALDTAFDLDPRHCVLFDDTLSVLDAAERHGVAKTIAIRQPDTRFTPRAVVGRPAVDRLADAATVMP